MLGRTYENENCSAARALEVVGERWSLLIVRDAICRGTTKFSEFQRNLGLAPNILASRLGRSLGRARGATDRVYARRLRRPHLPTTRLLHLRRRPQA
jgi:DNA-binding HxlR family transcriptional regulator